MEDIGTTIAVISAAGSTNIDLWGGLPNYSNDPNECNIHDLKEAVARAGMLVANLGTYPGRTLLELGEEHEWCEMTRAIDNARILGSRSIRVCPGKGEDPEIVPRLIPFFQRAAAYAEQQGVYLGMENHKGSIAGNPEVIMSLVHAVASPFFGILYEPANLMQCEVDYKDAYGAFKGAITHVHVKDSHWVNGEYSRTMLGEGDIDYSWVIDCLETDGYDGYYALEYEIEKLVPIEEGLPKWLACFREL